MIDRAVEAHFPLEQLVIAMQQHRAPRIIRTEGYYGNVLASPGISVLPGCLTSVGLAKGYVNPILDVVPQDDDHEIFQHVDDLHESVIAPSELEMVSKTVRYASTLAKAIEDSGLPISVKPVVLTNANPLVAQAIATSLNTQGYPVKTAKVADDLGASFMAGR